TLSSADAIAGYRGSLNPQSGTTYTLQTSDTGKIIEFSNGSDITTTLPENLGTGFAVTCTQLGTGQVTFTPDGSASLVNASNFTKTRTQYSMINLYVTSNTSGTNASYVMGGDGAA